MERKGKPDPAYEDAPIGDVKAAPDPRPALPSGARPGDRDPAYADRTIGDAPPVTGGDLWQNFKQGTSDTIAGLVAPFLNLAAVPQNIVAGVTGLPVGTPDQGEVVTNALGLPPPGNGTASAVIQNLAGVLPMVFGVGPAAQMAKNPVVRQVGKVLAEKPATQVVPAAASGVARPIIADSVTDDGALGKWAPTVRTGLEIAAGGAGAVGENVARNLPAAGRNVLGLARTVAGSTQTADDLARGAFLGASSDPAETAKALRTYAPEHGPAPTVRLGAARTTAEQMDDQGLLQAERTLRGGPGASAFAKGDSDRATVRTGVLDQIGGGKPEDVTDALTAQRNELDATATQAHADAAKVAADAQAAGGPGAFPEHTGPRMQAVFDAEHQASAQDVSEKFGAIDPDNKTAIRTKPAKDAITTRVAQEFGADPKDWPAGVKVALSRLATRDTTITELQSIRSAALNGQQGQVDGNVAAALRSVVDGVDAAVEAAVTTGRGITPETRAAWQTFRDASRAHNDRFSGPVGSDLNSRTYSRADTGPASIPGRFFKPGDTGADSMMEFNRIYAGMPEAQTAMRQHVAGKVAELVNPDTGELDTGALTRFINANSAALRQMPDVMAQLGNLRTARALADEARDAIPATREQFQKSVAGQYLGADPAKALDTILRGDNPAQKAQELATQLQDKPEALAALQREVRLRYAEATQSTQPSGTGAPGEFGNTQGAAEAWLRKNGAVVDAILTPEQSAAMRAVQENLNSGRRVSTAGKAPDSGTAGNISVGQAIDDYLSGRSLPFPWIRAVLDKLPGVTEMRASKAVEARAKLLEMMATPEAARDMLAPLSEEALRRIAVRFTDLKGGRGWPMLAHDAGRLTASGAAAAGAGVPRVVARGLPGVASGAMQQFQDWDRR